MVRGRKGFISAWNIQDHQNLLRYEVAEITQNSGGEIFPGSCVGNLPGEGRQGGPGNLLGEGGKAARGCSSRPTWSSRPGKTFCVVLGLKIGEKMCAQGVLHLGYGFGSVQGTFH